MNIKHYITLGCLLAAFAVIYYVYSRSVTLHTIDNYFIKHIMKNNSDFTHVTLKPYYTKGYYIQYHCGRNVYQIRDITIDSIYGAKIQSIQDDVCYSLGIPKDAMHHKIIAPATVIMRLNPGVSITDEGKTNV